MFYVCKDFQYRKFEINEYFSFVEYIDKIETHKKEKLSTSSCLEYLPKRELQKVLRANCYLMLYNLIESSICNCIIAIYDNIKDDSLKFEELSPQLQKIWLKHRSKQIFNKSTDKEQHLGNLINEVITGNVIDLDKESITVSGNLDYDVIDKVINAYGFGGTMNTDKNQIKKHLAKVKRERNHLAHGDKSFCQAGEIITIVELINIKNNIIAFLSEILANVEIYLSDKKYQKQKL